MAPAVDKKIMSEKIAKVKEVVQGISQNDIVLALHTFELDVEKTIQALCEDRSAVLDEWERPGGAKGKKNKNTQKKKAEPVVTPAQTSSVVHQKTEVVLPNISLTSQPKKPAPQTNGFHSTSSQKENSSEIEWLSTHDAEAAQIAASFSQECNRGREQIQTTFNALRQVLADREKTLLKALSHNQQEGERLIQDGRKTAKALLTRARASGAPDASLTADLKSFASIRRSEQQLANSTAFQYDMTKLVQSVANFGSVVEVSKSGVSISPVVPSSTSPVSVPIKHANSHSSIVSSEHDSGIGGGHISPVSLEKSPAVTKPKPAQNVSTGGFQMSSDGLSTEQLDALQKTIEAQLAARGIDASLVTSGNGVIASRPRNNRPRKDDNKKAGNGGPGAGGVKHHKKPELSILG